VDVDFSHIGLLKKTMTNPVLLSGVSRAERQTVISSAVKVIQDAGGWVEDVQFFSNIAVNLQCAAMPSAAAGLSNALSALGLGLSRGETGALESATEGLRPDQELRFSVQITFVHNEPDLLRHVPSVPG
jgi:hypothetical protein